MEIADAFRGGNTDRKKLTYIDGTVVKIKEN